MKKLITVLLLVFVALTGYNKDEAIELETQLIAKTKIPFTGIWKRQFLAGPGNLHYVNYFIYQDSIRYTLSGLTGNADYLMERDTFLLENNKFIGHTNSNQYYLMFIKNSATDSITVYKQEINDLAEGLSIDMPSDTTTQNHGWNTFHK